MVKAPHGRSRPSPVTEDADPAASNDGRARPTQRPPASGSERAPKPPEAVALYEMGMRAFQEHSFQEAVQAFGRVLTQYPEEKELNERVRVYMSACQRQLAVLNAEPQNEE